jgi:cell division transport system permease protein
MRANFVISGVTTGIRRNLMMTIALVLSTAIALAFVGSAYLASTEISRFKHNYENRLNVSVFLCASAGANCQQKTTTAQTANIRHTLEADPDVSSIKFVTEQEQLKIFDRTSTPEVRRLTKVGDLAASFTVKLKDIKKDFDSFSKKYSTLPGVSTTTNANDALNTLLNIIDGARLFSIVIALVVLVASILLIANTIQVAASQRKNETSIMRLVGASRLMTELPFMIETIVSIIIGGVISFGLLALGKRFVLNGIFRSPVNRGVIPDLTTNDVLVAGGIGLIAGVVLAALTALVTLRLYVRL